MDALEFFGMGIAATIGFCLGAAVMYFAGLIIDREEERT